MGPPNNEKNKFLAPPLSDGSMMTRWSAAAATPRSGRRGARKEWTLDGEESDKDAKDLGTMDVDLKDGVMVLMDRGQ